MDSNLTNLTPWSDRLALDMALLLEGTGEKLDELLDRHKIGVDDIARYNQDPVFLKRISAYRDDIQEKGLTFKLKAKAQAEELLTTSWMIIHAPDVSPAVKADLIKSTVKWAGYEPKDNPAAMDMGGGVRISINLGPSPADTPTLIDVTPSSSAQGE